MDHLLIDTDVLLDFFFDRQPFVEFATEILNQCGEGRVKGYITPVIICNVYYLLRKTARHELIVEKLKQLLTIIKVLKIDQEVILEALSSEFKDLEDALQNFSAVQNGKIKILLTRNLKDFRKSNLAVFTPETYLKGKGSSL